MGTNTLIIEPAHWLWVVVLSMVMCDAGIDEFVCAPCCPACSLAQPVTAAVLSLQASLTSSLLHTGLLAHLLSREALGSFP
jgi:hypothetical protein